MPDFDLNVFGPRYSLSAKDFLWSATAELTSFKHQPNDSIKESLGWRHVFLAAQPTAIGPRQVHSPGSVTALLKFKNIWIDLGDSVLKLKPRDGIADESVYSTMQLQMNPDDWDVLLNRNPAGQVNVLPDTWCVNGHLYLTDWKPDSSWQKLFPGWENPANLAIHSSGLSFDARVKFPWLQKPTVQPLRLNVLVERPGGALIVEVDRQWLFSDQSNAPQALIELRERFADLDSIVRFANVPSADLARHPRWVHWRLNNSSGPPSFYWKFSSKEQNLPTRFRSGELSLTLCDQPLGIKDVIPRSVAILDGEVTLRPSTDAFLIEVEANRPISVPVSKEPTIGEELQSRLSFADGSLQWRGGRTLSMADADLLRVKLPGFEAEIERLVELATTSAYLSRNVSPAIPAPLKSRVRSEGDALRWFDLSLTGSTDVAFDALVKWHGAATGPLKDALAELIRLLSPRLQYAAEIKEGKSSESFTWNDLETAYDANQAAEFLRKVHEVARPDPDVRSPAASNGRAEVIPAVLWGVMPLDNGWTMLPFVNITDEIYLRILDVGSPLTEIPLLAGAAIYGNDDQRLWSDKVLGAEQRWSLTILDADHVRGSWSFSLQKGEFRFAKAELEFRQPEVVFNGFLWLASEGPTVQDVLPDMAAWPEALKSISLRTQRTLESFPSPFLYSFPNGSCARSQVSTDSLFHASLGGWLWAIEPNLHAPSPVPRGTLRLRYFDRLAKNSRESDRLKKVCQIVWRAGAKVFPAAIRLLKSWESEAQLPGNFRQAVKRLRLRLPTIGKSLPDDCVESFVVQTGDKLPAIELPSSYLEIVIEIQWSRGVPTPADRTVLEAWRATVPDEKDLLEALEDLRSKLPANVFEQITAHPFYKKVLKTTPTPLLWQRHPRLPVIQSLSLTQTQSPPSHPSRSRSLAPFELLYRADSAPLTPDDWKFGSAKEPTTSGAASWPLYRGKKELKPAREWDTELGSQYLRLALLSVPGLSVHSNATAGPLPDPHEAKWLPMQISFGLPYLDEVYALAQLPREEGLQKPNGPIPATAPQTPLPIPASPARESLSAIWRETARLGRMAAAEADSMLAAVKNSKYKIGGLIEPYMWQATVNVNLAKYPGSVSFSDNGITLTLEETLSDGLLPPLQADTHSALRGLQATFLRQQSPRRLQLVGFDKENAAQTDITAGSAAATVENGQWRDQHGLLRSPTEDTSAWYKTALTLEVADAKNDKSVVLLTARNTIALNLGGFDTWQLWFKALPFTSNKFERFKTRSEATQGVNDPEAGSREYNHLQAYEWRLGVNDNTKPWLPVGPLKFFPLTLETVELDGESIKVVELVGRLQLPLSGETEERLDEANAVTLRFELKDGKLDLKSASITIPDKLPNSSSDDEEEHVNDISAELEWPLADQIGAPRIRATEIAFDKGQFEIRNPRLDFSVFGVPWTASLEKSILVNKAGFVFPDGGSTWTLKLPSLPTTTLAWRSGEIEPKADGAHSLRINALARWAEADQPGVMCDVTYNLLVDNVDLKPYFSLDGKPAHTTAGNFLDFAGLQTEILFGERYLQFSWDGIKAENLPALYVLPGMAVQRDDLVNAPGYASLSFNVSSPAAPPTVLGPFTPPLLDQVVGASELLLLCRWGRGLQDCVQVPPPSKVELTQASFSSSSGSVSVGVFTSISVVGTKSETATKLLLNGLVEIKNLISWPIPLPEEAAADNPLYTLPEAGKSFDHWRHTARILLNQLDLPHSVLEPAKLKRDVTLFLLKRETSDKSRNVFQFPAVVEHQLAELEAKFVNDTHAPTVEKIRRDFRWTVTQEVRLSRAEPLADYWQEFIATAAAAKRWTEDMSARNPTLEPIASVVSGWLRKKLVDQLAAKNGALRNMPESAMMVELSVGVCLPHYAKKKTDLISAGQAGFARLQARPGGTDLAIPLSLTDLVAPHGENFVPGPAFIDHDGWSMAVLPFVGRMQSLNDDGMKQAGEHWELIFPTNSPLQLDPLLWLVTPTRPPFVYDLTSRNDKGSLSLKMGEFDLALYRDWRWLDAVSLETNLYRLLSPPSEINAASRPASGSVLAALRTEGLGCLSRRRSLEQLFDPDAGPYPPQGTNAAETSSNQPKDFSWRYGGLLILHQLVLAAKKQEEFGFFGVGKRLSQILVNFLTSPIAIESGMKEDKKSVLVRLPAVTLLPPKMDDSNSQIPLENIGYALSPYLGLKHQRVDAPKLEIVRQTAVAVFADLLVLGAQRISSQLLPVVCASRLWQKRDDAAGIPGDSEIIAWAQVTRRSLAEKSLVAMVRIRRITPVTDSQETAVNYSFVPLPLIEKPAIPLPAAQPVRAELGRLRFSEGQFGGTKIPTDLKQAVLAPPFGGAIRPLHLEVPPKGPENGEALKWPFGWSGLVLDISVTKRAAIGGVWPADLQTTGGLWWSALSLDVQYLSTEAGKSTFLPLNFRAPAIRSLLPAPPNVPCPDHTAIKQAVEKVDSTRDEKVVITWRAPWQPILPTTNQMMVLGSRPGAFFAMRPLVIHQGDADGSATTSASIPIGHRFPRPVHIPSNHKSQHKQALAPWGSWFDLDETKPAGPIARSLVSKPNGHDSLFALRGEAASELEVELLNQSQGFSGVLSDAFVVFTIQVKLTKHGEADKVFDTNPQKLKMTITSGALSASVSNVSASDDNVTFTFTATDAERDNIRAVLGKLPHGALVTAELKVPMKDAKVTQPPQVARLPMRFVRSSELPLPLAATYCRFEDPQYNRRLSTPTARATTTMQDEASTPHQVTIAADRQQYNPTTKMFILAAVDPPNLVPAGNPRGTKPELRISFWRIDPFGGRKSLSNEKLPDKTVVEGQHVKENQLMTVHFGAPADFVDEFNILSKENLSPGDRLEINLTRFGTGTPQEVTVTVDIVAELTTPPPDAGYALLRREKFDAELVECARFAWGPAAGRIELVDPDDLLREVARRRAVFHWQDTLRYSSQSRPEYAVQKLMPGGSTVVPKLLPRDLEPNPMK